MITQGDVWWADLADPAGSEAGFRRPVVVVQADSLNRSRIQTVICIPLTSNLNWALALTNLLLPARATGLDRDSVAQTTLIMTINHSQLKDRVGRISERLLQALLVKLDTALGR